MKRTYTEIWVTKDYKVGEKLICINAANVKLTTGKEYEIKSIRMYYGDWRLGIKDAVYLGVENDTCLGLYWYLPDRFEPKSERFRINESLKEDFEKLKHYKEVYENIYNRIEENVNRLQTLSV